MFTFCAMMTYELRRERPDARLAKNVGNPMKSDGTTDRETLLQRQGGMELTELRTLRTFMTCPTKIL